MRDYISSGVGLKIWNKACSALHLITSTYAQCTGTPFLWIFHLMDSFEPFESCVCILLLPLEHEPQTDLIFASMFYKHSLFCSFIYSSCCCCCFRGFSVAIHYTASIKSTLHVIQKIFYTRKSNGSNICALWNTWKYLPNWNLLLPSCADVYF